MKRLFKIVDTNTNKMYGGTFYNNKQKAKEARRGLNKTKSVDGKETEVLRYIVNKGPDHMRVAS